MRKKVYIEDKGNSDGYKELVEVGCADHVTSLISKHIEEESETLVVGCETGKTFKSLIALWSSITIKLKDQTNLPNIKDEMIVFFISLGEKFLALEKPLDHINRVEEPPDEDIIR